MRSSWLLALRIAKREFLRNKGRSALAVIMIGLPICGIAAVSTLLATFSLTPTETLDRSIGTATASLSAEGTAPIDQDPFGENTHRRKPESGAAEASTEQQTPAEMASKLPPAGTTSSPYWAHRTVGVRTRNGVGNIEAWGLDLTNPLTKGIAKVKQGVPAKAAGEVMLTKKGSERLGVTIGGSIELTGDPNRYTVVGIVELPINLRDVAVFAPVAQLTGSVLEEPNRLLVGTKDPVTWSEVRRYNDSGIVVISREVITKKPPTPGALEDYQGESRIPAEAVAVVVVLVVVEVVLLVGPAFAIGAKRRRRELGLLAASGAAPAQIRRTVLADGLVAGAGGAVAGALVGMFGMLVVRGFVEERFVHRRAGSFRVEPTVLIALIALAVLVGVLASLAPAIATARQEVLEALNGRTGSRRVSRRWLLAGVALCLAGGALTLFGIGLGRRSETRYSVVAFGLTMIELGMVCCTPLVVSLTAKLGGLMPLSGRMALRDAGRNRAAAVPAIAAITAAVAGSISAGIFMESRDAQASQRYLPGVPSGYATVTWDWSNAERVPAEVQATFARDTEALVRNNLPVAKTVPMVMPICPQNGPLAQGKAIYCYVRLETPPERKCPYGEAEGPLTAEQRKAARHDQRCNLQWGSWYGFGRGPGVIIDDGSHLRTITGATGTDLDQAVATLRSGGVVVGDGNDMFDGKATVGLYMATHSTSDEDAGSDSGSQVSPSGAPSASGAPSSSAVPSGGAVPSGSAAPAGSASASAGAAGPAERHYERPKPAVQVTLPAHLLTTGVQHQGLILSPGSLAGLRVVPQTVGMFVETTKTPTKEQEERINGLFRARYDAEVSARTAASRGSGVQSGTGPRSQGGADDEVSVLSARAYVERGYPNEDMPTRLVTLVAIIVALGAAAVATGLTAADQRGDLSTLGAVGASPGLRRRLLVNNAGVISGLGSVLGVATGTAIAAALIAALNNRDPDGWPAPTPYPWAVPWLSVALIALVVPLVAMCGAGLFSRSRLPIERRL